MATNLRKVFDIKQGNAKARRHMSEGSRKEGDGTAGSTFQIWAFPGHSLDFIFSWFFVYVTIAKF